MAIVTPIGWLVSTVLLSVAFYLVFTPMAIVVSPDRPRRARSADSAARRKLLDAQAGR